MSARRKSWRSSEFPKSAPSPDASSETRHTPIRVIRDGIVIYTGKLGSLKRFKDDVKEVLTGQDCGLNIESFNDIRVGDVIEGYEQVEVKRN